MQQIILTCTQWTYRASSLQMSPRCSRQMKPFKVHITMGFNSIAWVFPVLSPLPRVPALNPPLSISPSSLMESLICGYNTQS